MARHGTHLMDEMAVDVDEGTGIVLRHDVVVPDLVVQGAGSCRKEGRGRSAGGRDCRGGKGVDARHEEQGRREAGSAKTGHDQVNS